MPKKRLKKNQAYQLKFFDHCIGDDDEEFIVDFVGFFLRETKNFYVFTHWLVDTKCEKTRDDNIEKSSILKKAIITIEEFRTIVHLQ